MLAEDDDLNNDSPVFPQTPPCHRRLPPHWISGKLAQWQAGAGVETPGSEEGQRARSHLVEQGSLEALGGESAAPIRSHVQEPAT